MFTDPYARIVIGPEQLKGNSQKATSETTWTSLSPDGGHYCEHEETVSFREILPTGATNGDHIDENTVTHDGVRTSDMTADRTNTAGNNDMSSGEETEGKSTISTVDK